MSRFLEALHSGRALLMDGAMGTVLQRAGLRENECGELWNLERPDPVRAIHEAYAHAGADCILTNTFQANHRALERHGLQDRQPAINIAGYELARSVAGKDRFVLVDIGPIVDPAAERPWEFCWMDALDHVVPIFDQADAILLETCSDPEALEAALIIGLCGRWIPATPILLSLAYTRDSSGALQTRSGHSPEWFASQALEFGVSALGVNCGKDVGMEEIIEIVRRYRRAIDLPLFARPNAGEPHLSDQRWIYPHGPEWMAGKVRELLDAGVSMVGGCCGTTPEHIAAFRPIIDNWNKGR